MSFNIAHSTVPKADGDRCDRCMDLVVQRDEYFEAFLRASDDSKMAECYKTVIQAIDYELGRLDYEVSSPSASKTSLVSSFSVSTVSRNFESNARTNQQILETPVVYKRGTYPRSDSVFPSTVKKEEVPMTQMLTMASRQEKSPSAFNRHIDGALVAIQSSPTPRRSSIARINAAVQGWCKSASLRMYSETGNTASENDTSSVVSIAALHNGSPGPHYHGNFGDDDKENYDELSVSSIPSLC
ncbi:hypothetical protein IV203_027424 [Nitzschia inconspicua]|uniref:Uncharacterized protein n=1 Tax=Nitzschia inconspicua TaxID=303405 RepID=A0A9K3LX88_9STRA|nr:hypothetical protein IV203_027424 [Nitzschia inconspicua]